MTVGFRGFIEKDFDSCVAKRSGALFVSKRMRLLRDTFVGKYPAYNASKFYSYVSRPHRRAGRGKGVLYSDFHWIGFTDSRLGKENPHSSAQLQVSIHEDGVRFLIWIDKTAEHRMKLTIQRNTKRNLPLAIKLIRTLNNYDVCVFDDEDLVKKFACKRATSNDMQTALSLMTESGSQFAIVRDYDSIDVIGKGSSFIYEIKDGFDQLAPIYRLMVGARTTGEAYQDSYGKSEKDDEFERVGKGQGFKISKIKRKEIENTAMKQAKKHFIDRGWKVKDVHSNHHYDLRCSKKNKQLLVEVKGTQNRGTGIIITAGEVKFARENPKKMALFILHSIDLDKPRSGVKKVINPWIVNEDELKPMLYMLEIK